MKNIDKMSRLTGELEAIFRLLNRDFFNDELPTPIITVVPTAKAYAHYVPFNIWETKTDSKREINISSAYLQRPFENIVASLMHEAVHMLNDCVLNLSDTSRGNTYHNKQFRLEAERHGLICTRTDKYGWAHTTPDDRLLEWVLEHDEFKEIEMYRTIPTFTAVGIGTHSNNSGELKLIGTSPNTHSIKYTCPLCRNSVRATKTVNVICGDCMKQMIAE